MSEVESTHNWYSYNEVARHGYFTTLSKLPPEELNKDRGASFPTLLDVLGHSMGGIEIWIGRMAALNSEPLPPYDGPDPNTLDDLRGYQKVVEGGIAEFFSRLTDADLDREYLVPQLPPWWDEDFTTSIRSTSSSTSCSIGENGTPSWGR
ncbi:MAG: DinB family protein [Thermoplasmata archaeon]